MKIVKKIAKIFLNILTILIFVILIITIFIKVKGLISNDSYFGAFGYSIFEVSTGSMQPAIKENDIIIVKKTNDYEVGDVITYKKDDAYITHRLIMISNDDYYTKGDANNAEDEVIKKNTVIGEVIKIYSKLGIWQKIFTTPQIIIAIFVTLILFDFAFSYKGKNIKKEKKATENDYTIRLDLETMQKEIDKKLKKDKK